MRRGDHETLANAYLLIRAWYSQSGTDDQRAAVRDDFNKTGEELATLGVSHVDQIFVRKWVEWSEKVGVSAELTAKVVMEALVDRPQVNAYEYFRMPNSGGFLGGQDNSQTSIDRNSVPPYWHAWIGVVNGWLQEHGADATPETVAAVIWTLQNVLNARSSSDDWPVADTARLLTSRLRPRYVDAEDKSVAAVRWPASSDALLAVIILCGGEIPDFVQQNDPQDEAVRSQLAVFEQVLNASPTDIKGVLRTNTLQLQRLKFSGLIQSAPFHTVKRVIESRGQTAIYSGAAAINAASTVNDNVGSFNLPPIEPLLLLAIATELTGVSEEQDERVGRLLDSSYSHMLLLQHVMDALKSPFVVRQIAEKWLKHMRERAKSELLKGRIDNLLPVSPDIGAAIE